MEKRTFGRTGLQLSVLGFGGAEIGAAQVTQEEVDRLLGSALDAGLNVIDTAECYGGSEEKIGKAVAHRRGDFHLFTKCGHEGEALGGKDWDPATLARSIDRSLQRLQTDCVDLVQLHTCPKEMLEQGDVIQVLQRAREEGKTRFIGYSGDNDAAVYAAECGAFDSLQTSINIADQTSVEGGIAAASRAGMGVIAKRPIANVAWRRGGEESFYGDVYRDRLKELAYDFLTTPEDILTAFRFALAVPGVTTLIAGTRNPDRWPANAELVAHGPLAGGQFEAIRARWSELGGDSRWPGQG